MPDKINPTTKIRESVNPTKTRFVRASFSLTFLDLVNNTEQILKDICDYLDIEFLKDRMLEGPKYNFVYPQDTIKKRES